MTTKITPAKNHVSDMEDAGLVRLREAIEKALEAARNPSVATNVNAVDVTPHATSVEAWYAKPDTIDEVIEELVKAGYEAKYNPGTQRVEFSWVEAVGAKKTKPKK